MLQSTTVYFLGTKVWQNQVFHDTRVPWTQVPWKNCDKKYIFSKNLSFKKMINSFIFLK